MFRIVNLLEDNVAISAKKINSIQQKVGSKYKLQKHIDIRPHGVIWCQVSIKTKFCQNIIIL